ncbi:MAG: HAD-IA family hydrolase [Gammaproteobacteria bacterium]
MIKLKLVLFDLDGTLADTAVDIARVTNRVLADADRPPLSLDEVRAQVSFGARALLRAGFGGTLSDAELEPLLAQLFAYYAEAPAIDTTAFPGLAECIHEFAAAGSRWGVVTNKPEALAVPIVAALGIKPEPICIIGGDTFTRKKPDPLPLLEACRKAGIAPDEAIYIGDAEIDARAASAAGMPLAVAGFGYAPARAEACRWPGNVRYAADTDELGRILGLGEKVSAQAS